MTSFLTASDQTYSHRPHTTHTTMESKQVPVYVSTALTVSAIIVCCVGLFADNWWMDESTRYHGLFTVVSCHDNVCVLSDTSSDGESWVTVYN